MRSFLLYFRSRFGTVAVMRAAFAFGICVLLFALFGDDHGVRAMVQARRDTRVLAAQLSALRAENEALRRRADSLRRDPAVIEQVARETLGFVRAGELIVRRGR
jgi:cell division protein FtsB